MVGYIEDRELFSNAKVIFDTREDSEERDKWLSLRGSSIGGSEIGAIAGFSKYASALTVFNDKLGISDKFKGNIHTKFGTRMEPHIRDWVQDDFKEATGITLTTYEYPYMMLDKDIPYFSANIDGLGKVDKNYVYYENRDTGEIKTIEAGELFGLEIKTGSEFLKKMWAGEEIPDSYYCQVQWYMGITRLNYFLIIYLLGKEVKWKVIPRNDDDIKALREIGNKFWLDNILTQTPPVPSGLAVETEQINKQQNLNTDDVVNITDEKLSEYNDVTLKIKQLEKEKERLKQEIFLEMGNSKKGQDNNFKISRYTISRDKLDTKRFKELYPATYEEFVTGKTEYVNMRVTKKK